MFSGIVEDVGAVVSVIPRGNGRLVAIRTAIPADPAAGVGSARREAVGPGDSIAVMGACLTVEAVEPPHAFSVVAGRETVECTTLGDLRAGSRVHLERALRLGDRLDGHLVSGHVDGVGRVVSAERDAESVVLGIEVPPRLGRYLARKGSVAIDGVSLTVNEAEGAVFRIAVIPFTAAHTLLGALVPGACVNIEVDLIARYVERLLGGEPAGGLTAARLHELGYGAPRGGQRRGGA